jgi:hypothetical protein
MRKDELAKHEKNIARLQSTINFCHLVTAVSLKTAVLSKGVIWPVTTGFGVKLLLELAELIIG